MRGSAEGRFKGRASATYRRDFLCILCVPQTLENGPASPLSDKRIPLPASPPIWHKSHMAFLFSDRAARLVREAGGHVRLAPRPGPQHARPMPVDFFLEEGPPADHVAFVAEGVTIWVPAHLTWMADNEVSVEAAADGHLHGAIEDVRLPF
ncbi:MAG: hypothetical protein FD180_999 [Planctomycetota bacterium]|nr:MAG: hypothetical protein FD180_999 [Planctomycetota bacterium]